MNNLVTVQDGRTVTTSRQVAEYFGKEHCDVLKAVKHLLSESSDIGDGNFTVTTYTTVQGYEKPMYLMDRDGFTLLAMGFTGKEALKFKVAYIKAFNGMEEHLRNQTPKQYTLKESLQLNLQLLEKNEELEKQNNQLKEKENTLNAIAGTQDLYTMGEVAKIISNECKKKIGSKTLFDILRKHKAICKDNTPTQTMVERGNMSVKITKYTDMDGVEHTNSQTLVTAKGLVKIREWLIKSDILKLK